MDVLGDGALMFFGAAIALISYALGVWDRKR